MDTKETVIEHLGASSSLQEPPCAPAPVKHSWKNPRLGYCLFEGPGRGVGRIVAVHDSFGLSYHWFRGLHNVGDILSTQIRFETNEKRRIAPDGNTPFNVKILRRVHPNEIYPVLRKIRPAGGQLKRGYWYECHGD